jgi:hypothetical protein
MYRYLSRSHDRQKGKRRADNDLEHTHRLGIFYAGESVYATRRDKKIRCGA